MGGVIPGGCLLLAQLDQLDQSVLVPRAVHSTRVSRSSSIVDPLTVRATLVSQTTWGVQKLSLITNLSHFAHLEYNQIDRTVMLPMGLRQLAWSVQLVQYVHLVQLEFEWVSSLNLTLVAHTLYHIIDAKACQTL